ncbi:MAG: DegT/DnrJ/EryC1/StrS family aminotransferase [Spirochaetaceae bacterium]|nr:DegT/DnrJ/EryC1/StrS family aminotransferase [Spirochaetaceae bacterium]
MSAVDPNGATWDGRQVGSIGDIGCFSMQSGKAVSGIEAGVATTDDPAKERGRTVGSHAAIEWVGA